MVSKEYPRIGEKIYHAELPNGLHIYVDRRPEFQKSYAFFATNYGGMDMKFRLDGQWRGWPTSWSTRCSIPRTATPSRIWRPTGLPPTPSPARPSPATILKARRNSATT